MAEPVPTYGGQGSRGGASPGVAMVMTSVRRWIGIFGGVGCALVCTAAVAWAANASGASPDGLHRRALAEDEIADLWAQRPVRSVAHRNYIYIDEEEIVDEYDLPVFRVEGLRSPLPHQLDRIVGADHGASARIADLAPVLARETVMRQRSEAAFYQRRPGVARDVPSTPDVLVGPLMSFLKSRR